MVQHFQQGLFRFDCRDESYGKGEDGFGLGTASLLDEPEQAQECRRRGTEEEDRFGYNIVFGVVVFGVVVFAVLVNCCHGFRDVVLSCAEFCFRVVGEAKCVRRVLSDGGLQHGGIAEDGDVLDGGCEEGLRKVF